jgi:hypothetical protein
MTNFDPLDTRALHALDPDFTINDEVATITGSMKVRITRADEPLQLMIEFPNGEEFGIWLSRAKTLEQLGIKDES